MNLMNKVISFFNRPFPPTENWSDRIRLAIAVAIFVTFFLYVFEPFGLSQVQDNKFGICLGFGSATLVASLLFEFVVVKVFGLYENSQNFTFGKWVLQAIGMILTISIANFLFGRWLQGSMDWRFFPQMIYATFAVGVFPTVVLGSISMMRQERKYKEIASDITIPSNEAKVASIQPEQSYGDIPISNIRYIESYQNYVRIGYLNKDSDCVEVMQRATLKSIQSELDQTDIVKCHRSFLVNKESIISVNGNAQGLLLSLESCSKEIPVSRSFVSAFR